MVLSLQNASSIKSLESNPSINAHVSRIMEGEPVNVNEFQELARQALRSEERRVGKECLE